MPNKILQKKEHTSYTAQTYPYRNLQYNKKETENTKNHLTIFSQKNKRCILKNAAFVFYHCNKTVTLSYVYIHYLQIVFLHPADLLKL